MNVRGTCIVSVYCNNYSNIIVTIATVTLFTVVSMVTGQTLAHVTSADVSHTHGVKGTVAAFQLTVVHCVA